MLLAEAAGKEFALIDDKYLKPLRNSVAHTILKPDESELKADDALDLEKINRWLSIAKCIARQLLLNDFSAELS
jgi:hypothetical protein